MRTRSVNWLYARLDKHIRLLKGYTEIDSIPFIIKSCRLKPYNQPILEREERTELFRHWFDEFGNSLVLLPNSNEPKLIFNDLSIDKKKLICTDLYYGLSMDQIVKMSKVIHLIAGKDDDLIEDCFLLTFLGIDNYLRSYLFLHGEWNIVSPLVMGWKHLKTLHNSANKKHFYQPIKKNNYILPCVREKSFLSSLPIGGNDFLDVIRKEFDLLLPIFEGK